MLRWQLVATVVLTLLAGLVWGPDGAISAALGGLVNVAAGWVYGWRVTRVQARTAGETLQTLFRAWGIKIATIIVLLGLALSQYRDIVHAAFFGTFAVTVAVFAAAIAVRESQ